MRVPVREIRPAKWWLLSAAANGATTRPGEEAWVENAY
jgi:hypothetical protein